LKCLNEFNLIDGIFTRGQKAFFSAAFRVVWQAGLPGVYGGIDARG